MPPLLMVSVFVELLAKMLPVPSKDALDKTVTLDVPFNAPVTVNSSADTVVLPV